MWCVCVCVCVCRGGRLGGSFSSVNRKAKKNPHFIFHQLPLFNDDPPTTTKKKRKKEKREKDRPTKNTYTHCRIHYTPTHTQKQHA